MDDTVRRQAAIEAINSNFGFNIEEEYGSAVQEVINGLPPAQSTYKDEEIQKMQDLEQAQIEKAYQLGYEEGKKDAQPEQRWIPIGSNPITTGLYLVLCNEWGKSMYRICAYYSEVGKWIENGKNITKSITHWMPLPEPWKGDKDA